jgi:hypothetical protein
MTRLLEQAIERLRAVPEAQQDQLASFLLNELEEEERWTQSTAQHEGALGRLIQDVLDDDRLGKCEPLDPDRL